VIGIAVLGAGRWGPNMVRNLHDPPRSEVRWAVDPDAARLGKVRERFPGVGVSTRPEEAIADPRVDAVAVVTPATTHYALARAALEAGKHVLVEKPMTTDSREAEELCALAARGGRVLMVGHVFLYNAAVRRVRSYVEQGELGRIYHVAAVRTNPGPVRRDVNAAWDLAAHDVAIANYWLDEVPVTASAVGGTWLDGGRVEDAVFATLRYPSGALLGVTASWLSPRKVREITVVGDRRMVTFDDMSLYEPLRLQDQRAPGPEAGAGYSDTFATFRAAARRGDVVIPEVTTGEPLKEECDHFLDCIANGRAPLTGGPSALAVIRTLEAVERSLRDRGREARVETCPTSRSST
jgi:predicted dehydrogenase